MIYPDQLHLSGEDAMVIPGDCLRACVAAVLGRETIQVPHFALVGQVFWMEFMCLWLDDKGYKIEMNKNGWDEEGYQVMPLHIMCGYSPRHVSHAVVGDTETGLMVHDPHPSRLGLDNVEKRFYLFKKKKTT